MENANTCESWNVLKILALKFAYTIALTSTCRFVSIKGQGYFFFTQVSHIVII